MIYNLNVNGQTVTVDAQADTPLLWVLRDHLHLNGTKYSCGIGACGACMVQVDGNPTFSCLVSINTVAATSITTIEGLAKNVNHPVIASFVEERVSQCGYCQTGMIMSAASLLQKNPNPSDQDIDQALSKNLCRCGTYQRVRSAIHRAALKMAKSK